MSPWPSSIELHCSSRTMELVWNGASALLGHHALRLACRCAECESRRRQGKPFGQVPEDIEVTRIELVGESGLRLFFSDGHGRGIFPWAYLYQLAFACA
jgi:DUF971 family protein